MTDVIVSVEGSSEEKNEPELAVVAFDVSFEQPEMSEAIARTTKLAGSIQSSIEALNGDGSGPITRWSVQLLRTWTSRPWGENGKQLDLVFHAGISFSVTFSDFESMARLTGSDLAQDGVNVGRTSWMLTEAKNVEVSERVRVNAVHDAATKARSYADALDLDIVRPIEIADVGLLAADPGQGGGVAKEAFRAASMADQSSFQVKPGEITVSAQVQARFLARVRS